MRYLCLAILLGGCATTSRSGDGQRHPPAFLQESEEELFEGEDDEMVDDEGHVGGFWDYVGDRALDLLDTASFRVLVGPGLRFNARVTEVVQLGAGFSGPTVRDQRGFSMETHFVGLQRRQGGIWTQRTSEAGVSLFYFYEADGDLIKGDKSSFGPADRGFFDVGFAAHLGVVGAEAEVRVDEVIDFVLGFFAIDIMGDDY